MNIHPFFIGVACAETEAKIAQVLQTLYNEYAGKVEFENADRFHRFYDEVGKPILGEEEWFEAIVVGTL